MHSIINTATGWIKNRAMPVCRSNRSLTAVAIESDPLSQQDSAVGDNLYYHHMQINVTLRF